ncbi:hypothetical protein ACHAXT_009478 [Thalassiosira profunda]
MKPEVLARRAGSAAAADGGGIPSPAPDARKESDGDGKKVATGSNDAAWDEDEEALGALIYKASRAAKARDEVIIGKKRRASKEDEAPARSKREDMRKESGETSVTPRASSSSAKHDVDEEALGALIYKNSRTAKARAQANNGNKRRREKPLSSDEGKPPRKKRKRKAKKEDESSREKCAVPGSSTSPRRGAAIKAAAKLSRSGSGEQRETSVTRARPRRHVVAIEAPTKISGHMLEEDDVSDDDVSLGYDSDSSGVTSKRPYRSGHRRNGNKGTPLKPEEHNNQYWNEKYEQLKAYRAYHGHCNVPQRYGNDPQLGRWVKKQRYLYKKGKLSVERTQLLDDIEFEWNAERDRDISRFSSDDELWGERLEQLRAYKEEHGDCNVPKRYALLGKWVQWQRYLYKKGKLADERKERLEEIGFNWVGDKKGGSQPNNEQWNERLKQVRAYKAEHGDCKVRQKYEVDGSKLGVQEVS